MRAEVNTNKVEEPVTGTSLDAQRAAAWRFQTTNNKCPLDRSPPTGVTVNTIILYNPNLPSHKSNQTSQGDTCCHRDAQIITGPGNTEMKDQVLGIKLGLVAQEVTVKGELQRYKCGGSIKHGTPQQRSRRKGGRAVR